ncbi:amidohydrolase family protein [bacterium]|nr:amidohydrolase family protein [bacterium]
MREYFDFNVMIGKPTIVPLNNWLDVDRLNEEMGGFNIKKALVYHSYSRDYDAHFGNEKLIEEIKDCLNLYVTWVLLPLDIFPIDTFDELLEEFRKNNIKAVRFFPDLHNFLLEEEVIGDLLSFLEELKVPILISPNNTGWKDIYSILRNHPNIRLVLIDLTYRQSSYIFPLLKRYENIYVELSGYITFLGIETLYKRFGGEKMLFGSNLPYKNPGSTIYYIEKANIPEEVKDCIAYKNADRLIQEVDL